jgi:hypothetical protein
MKSGIINKDKNYSLNDIENYKKDLDCNINDVTNKYSLLIIEYFKFIKDNIKVSSSNLVKFITIRGLDTITNVFLHILYYTKNIDLTYFHSQKSFYFYVEFVGQISDDEKMFLQLTSRDATTYVYKKTIFEINNELKKISQHTTPLFAEKIEIIKIYINIYQTYLLKIINTPKPISSNANVEQFMQLTDKLNSLNNKSKIHSLENIIDKLYHKIENTTLFFEVNEFIIKKFLKNKDMLKNIEEKINIEEFDEKINGPCDKFINWFTC